MISYENTCTCMVDENLHLEIYYVLIFIPMYSAHVIFQTFLSMIKELFYDFFFFLMKYKLGIPP